MVTNHELLYFADVCAGPGGFRYDDTLITLGECNFVGIITNPLLCEQRIRSLEEEVACQGLRLHVERTARLQTGGFLRRPSYVV